MTLNGTIMTSCIVSWGVDAPNVGTISKTVVSTANFHMEERVHVTHCEVIDQNQKEPWASSGSLWNSDRDWFRIPEAIRIKFDPLVTVS